MVQTDPITVATIWHFLQRVCREMRDTTERTATNVLATSLHDLAYGIWDAKGQVIAIPEGFPCRLISSTFPIKYCQYSYIFICPLFALTVIIFSDLESITSASGGNKAN